MKKLLIIIVLFLSFGCKTTSEVKDNTTTYYFIRHAEKDKTDLSEKDPILTEKGQKRAENWSKHFKNVNFDAIYSTDYNRTKATALPTAKAKNLSITSYHPRTLDIESFLTKTKNQTVLVVGHSNTTPSFVNSIIGEKKYKSIDETVNSKLFTVTIKDDLITHNVKDISF